jgi:ribosomal protein L7/L12
MSKLWKLNKDLHKKDNIFDGFTFEDIITAVQCNCKTKNKASVLKEYKALLEIRLQDAEFLIENNIDEILKEV